jgi:hypothetical protein
MVLYIRYVSSREKSWRMGNNMVKGLSSELDLAESGISR